ncbi:MAG: hypothetical protein HY291_09925, partial [Planctomycetes bacterium]|nr:hypothetical protein [Planctomycetota bacterium]
EALTLSERPVDAGDWVGRPLVPEWALALKGLVTELHASPTGPLTPRLEAPRAFQDVALRADRLELIYRSGIAGQRRMEELLDRLTQASPEVQLPSGALNEVRIPGPVRDLVQLAQQAEAKNFRVVAKNNTDMPAQAFVNRTLPLGVELEWAARISGQGVRADAGSLVVDAVPLCYGAPALQAVNLQGLSNIDPDRASIVPQSVATQVKAWFPELFLNVTLYPVNCRLVFFGDRRQVWAVQRVCRELEADLRKAAENRQPLDLNAWKPAWRVELEKNLAEPFRGDGSGRVPEGGFAGVLRQSGQFIQLRSTLLVDPGVMRRLAQKQIPQLDVNGKTLGEALALLAEAAGLRVVIEDEVVWLRSMLDR